MRIAPLLAIVLVVAAIGASMGAAFVWFIAGVSLLALGVLFFFMVKQGQFMGPKVLMEEPEDPLSRLGNGDGDETIVVVHKDRTDG